MKNSHESIEMFKVLLNCLPTLMLFLSLISFNIEAQNKYANLDKSGLAIQGYDPVSYFSNEKPLKGNSKISFAYDGMIYQFFSEKNKSEFVRQPKKYEPKYGGWCAYAIGVDGSKVKIDPETYKIVDGELYLFYNFFPVNTLKKWNDNEKQLKQKADTQWTEIISPR